MVRPETPALLRNKLLILGAVTSLAQEQRLSEPFDGLVKVLVASAWDSFRRMTVD